MQSNELQELLRTQLGSDISNHPNFQQLTTALNEKFDELKIKNELLDRSNNASIEAYNKLLFINKHLNNELSFFNEKTKNLLCTIAKEKGASTSDYASLQLDETIQILQNEIHKWKSLEEKHKQSLATLEKANKELDQFAYVVSHDLKAPLRAIASLADWIEEDTKDKISEDSRSNLSMLKGRVLRMEALIHGILSYAKAGKIKCESKVIDLNYLLNEIIDSLNPPSFFQIQIQENLPSIETEQTKLFQVFSNLISNAIKYNDKVVGNVKVSFYEKEGICQFSVEDNGPGIEKEYHSRVFMIFQTLSARDEFESTGIGLSIVKKIVEEQGGKIWIESEKNKFTRFNFSWPSKVIIKKSILA
jgi:signal transduction histidine kinase